MIGKELAAILLAYDEAPETQVLFDRWRAHWLKVLEIPPDDRDVADALEVALRHVPMVRAALEEGGYVPADLARARVAAAYEAAVQEIEAFRGEEDVPRTDKAVLSDQTCNDCCDLIRALTDADARAALDRLLAEARAQEREALLGAADELGYECEGCGHLCGDPEKDLALIRRAGGIACCPERKMRPLSAAIRARGAAQEGEG